MAPQNLHSKLREQVTYLTPLARVDTMQNATVTEDKIDRSSLVSRNVTIGAHRTSIRLEPDMWNALREICRREHVTIHDIASVVSVRKAPNTSLTAAIRVFVMAYFRMAATEEGHNSAGHGPGGSFMSSLLSKKSEEQDNRLSPFTNCVCQSRQGGLR